MSSKPGSGRRATGIGLGYVFTSSYFIFNIIALLIYPTLRFIGLRQTS